MSEEIDLKKAELTAAEQACDRSAEAVLRALAQEKAERRSRANSPSQDYLELDDPELDDPEWNSETLWQLEDE